MKKSVLFFLFLGCYTVGWSQAHLIVGVKGGINSSTFEGSSVLGFYSKRTGYHIGAFTSIGLGRVAIQPEIQISNQGAILHDLSSTSPMEVINRFNYVNIPILLKYYLLNPLYIQAGPQFGMMKNAIEITGNYKEDVLHLYNQSDVSIGLGVGLELPLGITVEGRYNAGLTNINNDAVSNEALRNQVYQLSIGLRFIDVGSSPLSSSRRKSSN